MRTFSDSASSLLWSYERLLELTAMPVQMLFDPGGRLDYHCWADEPATIQLESEGSKARLRVWDRIQGRVRDEVLEPADVHSRFAIEIQMAQRARLN